MEIVTPSLNVACVLYVRDLMVVLKVALFSTVCSLPLIATLSLLFNRLREVRAGPAAAPPRVSLALSTRAVPYGALRRPPPRQPVERAIIGDWIKQTKSAWWRFCGRDKNAPKGKKHLPPKALAAEKLRKKGPAAAVVPYCTAFTIGLGCTLVIALVVVTFDTVFIHFLLSTVDLFTNSL